MNLSTKNPLITGTLLLATAGILTRIIGFFYKIFLSRTIGAEGLGIYQLIFPVMGICFSLTSAGIQTSISKYVSMEIGKRNPKGARLYLFTGLCLSTGLSFLIGVILWKNASSIAITLLGEPRCAQLLKIIAFSYVPCSIHACINGYYYGMKKAAIPSVSQLAEQLVRVGSVYLFYTIMESKGQQMTIAMAVWGITLGEIGGMLVSLSAMGYQKAEGNIAITVKNLLCMAIPLTANRLVLNLFSSVENILIPKALRSFGYTTGEALSVFGILTGMSFAIIMAPSVITNSISVLLLPTVSEAQAKNNQLLIKRAIFRTAVCCILLGSVCTLCFLFTGDFIGNFLFHNSLAGTFIKTISWICPFLYMNSTLISILHGLGLVNQSFFINLFASIIRILFVLFLIPVTGIRAYLYGLLIAQLFVSVTALGLLSFKIKCTKKPEA